LINQGGSPKVDPCSDFAQSQLLSLFKTEWFRECRTNDSLLSSQPRREINSLVRSGFIKVIITTSAIVAYGSKLLVSKDTLKAATQAIVVPAP
jgi:hypothetical protein